MLFRSVCTELWPGNTTDVTTLIPIVDRVKQTFHVREVSVVADRGMISANTIDELDARGWSYILGVRMRSSTEAQAIAATDDGHYRTVFPRRATSKDPAPLRVKQVWRDGTSSASIRTKRPRPDTTERRSSPRWRRRWRRATNPSSATRAFDAF